MPSSKVTIVPRTCSLYMTDRCNLQCSGCSRTVVGSPSYKEMRLSTVQRMVEIYPEITDYCIAGLGEPTLCTDFVDIVNSLKAKGKFVGLITNGTTAEPILELNPGPDYVSISLYGYDAQSYEKYCGVSVFDTVIANYHRLKERHSPVGFSFIVSRNNYAILEQILLLCDSLQPDFLHLVNYLAYDANNPEEAGRIITTDDTDIIASIERTCGERKYITSMPVYPDFNHPTHSCRSYESFINLDGEGNIGGCQRQLPPDRTYGNIFEDADPYNLPVMEELRKKAGVAQYHDNCKYCFGDWSDFQSRYMRLEVRHADLRAKHTEMETTLLDTKNHIDGIFHSFSWRSTAVFRWLLTLIRSFSKR